MGILKKICLLVNTNLYESKRYFAQKFAEAWLRKNVKVLILDWGKFEDKTQFFDKLKKFIPDLTCSFNTVYPINGQYLWDRLQIPHLAYLVDPAFYSYYLTKSPHAILSCVDRKDYEDVKALPFNNTLFLPHAVERELNYSPEEERIIDVVFLGSFNDYIGIREAWQQKYPKNVCSMLDAAADLVLSDQYIPLDKAFLQSCQEYKIDQSMDIQSLFSDLDTYTRGLDRVQLIKSIKNPKIKIHILGHYEKDRSNSDRTWGDVLGNQKNVIIHPQVPFKKNLEILKLSKICLNSMPFFKDGTHERIFNGLACGSLPITTSTLYIEEQFKNGEDLITYQPKQWDNVEHQILELLENEEKRKEMVIKGRQKVMANHTWDNRVDYLLQVLPNMIIDIMTQ